MDKSRFNHQYKMSSIKKSQRRGQDYMEHLMIGHGHHSKVIEKQLMELLIDEDHRPRALLSKSSQLLAYLQRYDRENLERAIEIFDKQTEFYLLRIGTYLAVDRQHFEYLLFTDQLITFLKYSESDRSYWEGFTYKVGLNAYVGGFQKQEAHGKGRGLFLDGDHIHEFIGEWEKGAIKFGKRNTYKSGIPIESQQVMIYYNGPFKKFKFDGEGELRKNGKTILGLFSQGYRIKNKNQEKSSKKSPRHLRQKSNDQSKKELSLPNSAIREEEGDKL